MILYPAIDLREGKVVRLTQGLFDKAKVYFENPLDAAQKWVNEGAQWLHVVDLDGALTGQPTNVKAIESILQEVEVPVQIGGGIRTEEIAEIYLTLGAGRIVMGTAALEQPDLIATLAGKYPDRIAVGIDAKKGKVSVKGWKETTGTDAIRLAIQCVSSGATHIITTDIRRDGTLTGPNFEAIQEMKDSVGVPLIASGGVSSLDDLRRLSRMNLEGVIVGSALYEGRFSLKNGLAVC